MLRSRRFNIKNEDASAAMIISSRPFPGGGDAKVAYIIIDGYGI